MLNGAGFAAEVSAYYAEVDGQRQPRANFLAKLSPEVLAGEQRLGS